jgi:hypothetical protein
LLGLLLLGLERCKLPAAQVVLPEPGSLELRLGLRNVLAFGLRSSSETILGNVLPSL